MAERRILSLGETLIDLIASDGSHRLEDVTAFDVRPGGAPANCAVALARLGEASAFCGVVGDDPFGARLRGVLEREGVDATRLRHARDAETTIAYAWKDDRGDGRFRLLTMADRLLSVEDVALAEIGERACIVVGSVALAHEPARSAIELAVELAGAARVPVVFDVNIRPMLWADRDSALSACEPILRGTTLIKMSLDDVGFLLGGRVDAEDAFGWLARFPAPFRVLTDGSRGAWLGGPDETEYLPAFVVDAIDPTGAGDAFTAATISRLHARGWSGLDREDLRFAAAAGAITTTRRGAMEALPSRHEVEAFLAARS